MKIDPQKIEDYVLGRLSENDKDEFQFALMRDAGLRKEVEAMRALKYMARAQKREKRRGIVFFSPARLWRVAAVFIGLTTLAVLIALYNRQERNDVVDKNKKTPTEQKENFKEQQLVEDEKEISPQLLPDDSIENNIVKRPEEINKQDKNSPQKKELEFAPQMELPDLYSNERDNRFIQEPDSTKDEYVETTPDSLSKKNEPVPLILEPEVASYIGPPSDTSKSIDKNNELKFDLTHSAVADFYSYSDFYVNENGDTIAVNVDSLLALDKAKKELERIKEMAAYPKEVSFYFSPPNTWFANQDYAYLYHAPPEIIKNNEHFSPSPPLEEWLKTGNLNDSLDITFRPSGQPFVADMEGQVTLEFSYHVYGQFDDSVNLNIYSNHAQDFIDRRPLGSFPLELLNSTLKANLRKGRYYAVFENTESGEILAAKSFTVIDEYPFQYERFVNYLKRKRKPFKKFFQNIFKKNKPKTNSDPAHAPHPELEALIENPDKTEGLELNTYTNGKFKIYPDGNAYPSWSLNVKSPEHPDLYFFVYSNNPEQFGGKYPMVFVPMYDLLEEVGENEYYVEIGTKGNFRPGLYYFVLTDSDRYGAQVLAVERFVVKENN